MSCSRTLIIKVVAAVTQPRSALLGSTKTNMHLGVPGEESVMGHSCRLQRFTVASKFEVDSIGCTKACPISVVEPMPATFSCSGFGAVQRPRGRHATKKLGERVFRAGELCAIATYICASVCRHDKTLCAARCTATFPISSDCLVPAQAVTCHTGLERRTVHEAGSGSLKLCLDLQRLGMRRTWNSFREPVGSRLHAYGGHCAT